MHITPFFQGLIWVGSVGFLVAIYYSIKLSREANYERYWMALGLSAIFLALHQWSMLTWDLHLISDSTKLMIEQISAVLGSLTFGYAVYGLSSSMKKIRKKME